MDKVDSIHYSSVTGYMLIRMVDASGEYGLKSIQPDYERLSLMRYPIGSPCNGIIVTVASGRKHIESDTSIEANSKPFISLVRLPSPAERIASIERAREKIICEVSGIPSLNFYSRFFAPWLGVNKDPVTGSAHTVLMPFWSAYHPSMAGLKSLVGKQCSKRGGIVQCTLVGDRVTTSGSTRIVVKGSINV